MEKVQSHKMWCYECQKDFSIQTSWEDASCIICGSEIIEKIESDPHLNEMKSQEVISRNNRNII